LIRQFPGVFWNFYTAQKPEMIKLQSFQMQFEFAKVELRVQCERGEGKETHKPVYKFYIIFQSIIVVDFSFSTVHNTEKKIGRDLDPQLKALNS